MIGQKCEVEGCDNDVVKPVAPDVSDFDIKARVCEQHRLEYLHQNKP